MIQSVGHLPRHQLFIAVLWPSFLTAVMATGIFFSAFHPVDLIPFNLDFEASDLAFYSVGFFVFWLLGIISSYGTLYFTITNTRSLVDDATQQP